MTVPATDRRAGPFLGTGAIVALPFTFKVFAQGDVVVTRKGLDNVETTLALGDDYTVTLNPDQDAAPGGSVTPIVAPLSGETTTLTSGVSTEQTLDLISGGAFRPNSIEDALDRAVILVQQLDEVQTRTLRLPISADADAELPVPVAGNVIGWDDTATALRNIDPATLASVVAYANWNTEVFSGTGAQTAFVLAVDPGSVHNCDVAIGGVAQTPSVDFTVSGTTLTFTSPPPVGTGNVVVRYGQALPAGTNNAQNVTLTALPTGVDVLLNAEMNRLMLTPERFGAVGDGVTNDALALQRFLQYLADYGGFGYLPPKTYLTTSALALTTQTYGFTLRGSGPQSVIRQRTASAVTCISIVGAHDIVFENFKIDCGYSVTGFASHGISMRNPDRVTCRGVEVYDHRNTAILTFVDVDDTYGDCHFVNCISRSNGNGQNGFLHEGMLRSSIDNCTVHPLDPAGSPCVGLQIKNRSKHCWITGGFAAGCKSGVALGGGGATFGDGPFNTTIRGVITKDCLDGATIGKSTDCFVEIDADMTNSPAPGVLTGYALNVAGANVNLSAKVRIKGVQSGRTCILVRSDDVSVDVPYINGWGSAILEMSAGVNRCRVIVRDAVPAISNIYDLVLDSSGQTDNEIVFLRDLPVAALAGNQFMYFRTPGKSGNWISYNSTTDTYSFRNNGTDRFSISPTAAFPGVDASLSLGTTGRRFTNVFTQGLTLVDGVTAPATIAGHAVIYVDTADGDLKIKFADGTVKTIVIDT